MNELKNGIAPINPEGSERKEKKIQRGRIVKWVQDRGYGFVNTDVGNAFVHISSINCTPEEALEGFLGKTLVFDEVGYEAGRGYRIDDASTERYVWEMEIEAEEKRKKEEEERLNNEETIREAEAIIEQNRDEIIKSIVKVVESHKDFDNSCYYDRFEFEGFDAHYNIYGTKMEEVSNNPLKLMAKIAVKVFLRGEKYRKAGFSGVFLGVIKQFDIDGWEHLRLDRGQRELSNIIGRGGSMPVIPTWNREKMTADICFTSKDFVSGSDYIVPLPIKAEAPYRINDRILQKVSCHTPCGDIEHVVPIFSKDIAEDNILVWGNYNIDELLQEAKEHASVREIKSALARKYEQEKMPYIWDESGSSYTSHSETGFGLHGGDYSSITYTNVKYLGDVNRLVESGTSLAVLEEVAKLPEEALRLGWSFEVPKKYYGVYWGTNNWPTVKVPITADRRDNDLKSVERPALVDPVQLSGYREAFNAVLNGMKAGEAIEIYLGACTHKEPNIRQQVSAWIRDCRKNGIRDRYDRNKWKEPPEAKDPELANKIADIFIKFKEEQLIREGIEEEEARLAAQKASEEKKILDMAMVKKDWKDLLSKRNSYLKTLDPEAKALLDKIRAARTKVTRLRERRERDNQHVDWERLRVLEEERERQKKEESDKFLSNGAWDALDGLKF